MFAFVQSISVKSWQCWHELKRGFSVESTRGGTGIAFFNQEFTRRRLLGMAASVAAVGALAACSGGTGSGSDASKLTFVFYGDAAQQAAVKKGYADFSKANPDITFEAQGIAAKTWAEFANTLATRIAGGAAPDVIDIATEGLGIFRSKKLIEDLGPFIKKDQADIDDYYADIDPTYKAISDKYGNPGGTTFYMPGGFNTVCLYCNNDIFQKAGVELPGSEDWTWDDFEAAAEKVKTKTGAFMLPFGTAQFTDIMPWLLSNGASTLNADWTAPVINSPAAIEAAEFCKRMVDKGYSPKPGGTFDAATQLSNGKLAMLAGGRWPNVDMQRLKLVDKVQIVKNPKKTQNGTPIGWDTFPILTSSKNKDDAWTFIKYLTTADAATASAKAGGTNIPARKSVALSDAFLDGAPKGSDLLYAAASYATPVPSPDRGAESQKAVEEMWLKILTGSVKAEDGLSQLSDKLAGLL
jgi:multiple sugar transport system substrate-binding protein